MTGRRRLYDEARVRALFSAMRDELRSMGEKHTAEVESLRREFREALQIIVGTLRQTAESDVATLRRQLELALARIERDPQKQLH